MNFFLQKSDLRELYEKVVDGGRISDADALRLFESRDLNAIGAIADFVRQRIGITDATTIDDLLVEVTQVTFLQEEIHLLLTTDGHECTRMSGGRRM